MKWKNGNLVDEKLENDASFSLSTVWRLMEQILCSAAKSKPFPLVRNLNPSRLSNSDFLMIHKNTHLKLLTIYSRRIKTHLSQNKTLRQLHYN